MTENDMKKLSRADLLEMLIDQSNELNKVKEKLNKAEAALKQKELYINNAGSIAEASLKLNGVFEAAQAASQQYMDNIKLLSERQASICRNIERETFEKADRELAETQKKCAAMEAEAKIRCAEMVTKAKAESQYYWDELVKKLDVYYEEHKGLRELLSVAIPKKEQG